MKPFLKSTANWGILFCVLAAIAPALPWSCGYGVDLAAIVAGSAKQVFVTGNAYTDWQGAAITIAGGVGVLFLVATGGLNPAPWWRTLGIGVVGVAIIVFTIIWAADRWNHFPIREFGGLLAVVSGTGLLGVACLEIRRLLERQANEKSGPPIS